MSDGSPFPEIERTDVSEQALASFTTDANYRELAFNLLREVASYLCVVAGVSYPNPWWTRDQAIVGGLVVRLFKLSCAVLDQVNEGRQEQIASFSRQIYETVVNVCYLVAFKDASLFDSYIRHSLKQERRLRDEILRRITERGDEPWHIETRMLKSIARAEKYSGVSLDTIDLKDKRPWGGKDTRQKAQAVGLDMAYDPAFGGFSRNIHGGWHDVFEYHLQTVDDEAEEIRFQPKMDWKRVRPQLLFTLAWLIVRAAKDAAGELGGSEASELLDDKLSDLRERIIRGDEAHERYLSTKTWPEV